VDGKQVDLGVGELEQGLDFPTLNNLRITAMGIVAPVLTMEYRNIFQIPIRHC
jgi:hypothetical protein